MDFQLNAALLAFAVPFVIALVEAIKRLPGMEDRTGLCPFIAIVLGLVVVAMGAALWPPEAITPWRWAVYVILHGLAAGLSAMSLYSLGAKTAIRKLLPTRHN